MSLTKKKINLSRTAQINKALYKSVLAKAKSKKDSLYTKYIKSARLASKYRRMLKEKYSRRLRPEVIKKLQS